MPPTYQQANRPMTVTTPLGPDVLLLVGFSGHEAISQLFSFELDLAAEDQTKVVFEKVLGRKVTVNLTVPGGQKRHFSGICTSLTQGMRGIDHTSFQMEISPHLWLLTLRCRSRIFQNLHPCPRSLSRSSTSPTWFTSWKGPSIPALIASSTARPTSTSRRG